jgi:hypothetical protein
MRKEAPENPNYTARAERDIYNNSIEFFLKMLTDLKAQNPNVSLEDLLVQLSKALNEANEIMLLRETKSS